MLRNRAKRKYETVAQEIQFSEFYRTAIILNLGNKKAAYESFRFLMMVRCPKNSYAAMGLCLFRGSKCHSSFAEGSVEASAEKRSSVTGASSV